MVVPVKSGLKSVRVMVVPVCKTCPYVRLRDSFNHFSQGGIRSERRLFLRVPEPDLRNSRLLTMRDDVRGRRLGNHRGIHGIQITGIISCSSSDRNRLSLENRLIVRLGTLAPLGINVSLLLV
jgi:hypothetical protein